MNKEHIELSKYNEEGTIIRKAQLRLLEMMIVLDKIFKKHKIPYVLSGGTCLGAVRHGGFIPWDDDVDIDMMRKEYKKILPILEKDLPDKYEIQTIESDKNFYFIGAMRIVDKHSYVLSASGDNDSRFRGLFIDILPDESVISYRLKRSVGKLYRSGFHIRKGMLKDSSSGLKRLLAGLGWYPLLFFLFILRKITFFTSKEKISNSYGALYSPRLKYSEIFPPKPMLFEGYEFLGPAKPHDYLKGLYGENYMQIPPKEKWQIHSDKIEVYEMEDK
ncbi:MAG TPA: LicD family protein [Chitinophagaceae bacterium]|nr:LicD family protein [Chitinophagaceae bacterium]